MATAMCMAVGKVSLELWLRLTWSFGWTGVLEPSSPPMSSIALRQKRRGETHISIIHLLYAYTLSPVTDDLVSIHVGLSTRAHLPHQQRKVLIQFPLRHLKQQNDKMTREWSCSEIKLLSSYPPRRQPAQWHQQWLDPVRSVPCSPLHMPSSGSQMPGPLAAGREEEEGPMCMY